MPDYCHSCTMPLDMPDARGASDIYCKYCSDDSGSLKSREEVRQGIAGWFKSWQGGIDDATALRRADSFMRAMPAWAED